jgi:hypothetical protein
MVLVLPGRNTVESVSTLFREDTVWIFPGNPGRNPAFSPNRGAPGKPFGLKPESISLKVYETARK